MPTARDRRGSSRRPVRTAAATAALLLLAGGCIPPGTWWKPVDAPSEVPTELAGMLGALVTGTVHYVAIEEPCADNANDGLAPTCEDGHGPWRDLTGLANLGVIAPGDAVVLREGVYPVDILHDGLRIPSTVQGTPSAPVQFLSYRGEEAVLDGGFDLQTYLAAFSTPEEVAADWLANYHGTHVLAIDAHYLVVRGLRIRGCAYACIQWRGSNSILADSVIDGGVEDGIKTTYFQSEANPSRQNLVIDSTFTGFGDQAIDAWGTRDFYVVRNRFHANDASNNFYGSPGTPIWTKGGSTDVWYLENTFEDLVVDAHALNLGGCCWNNWSGHDPQGNLLPVAERVHARRNVLRNVSVTAGRQYDGAIGVEGCRDCEVRDNLLVDVTTGIGVHRTQDGALAMETENVLVEGNTLVSVDSGQLVSVVHGSTVDRLDDQLYYQDGSVSFRAPGVTYTSLAGWQAGTGHDLASSLRPESEWTG